MSRAELLAADRRYMTLLIRLARARFAALTPREKALRIFELTGRHPRNKAAK